MRAAGVLIAFAAALVASVVGPLEAQAAWGTEPVTISPTTATIASVEACSDGANGTFVVWHEAVSGGTGPLRIQHLLPDGQVDPSWPAEGGLVTAGVPYQPELSVFPDGLGGLYVFWRQSSQRALRLNGSGQVAAGWPAGGRVLGASTVSVIEDGNHGFYAAWTTDRSDPETCQYTLWAVEVTHVGPENTPGEWPGTTVFVSPPCRFAVLPRLALAPDGGVFVASMTSDVATMTEDSLTWWARIHRLSPGGVVSPNWPDTGRVIHSFRASWASFDLFYAGQSLLSLSADGRGGVFFILGTPIPADGIVVETRLHRLSGTGTPVMDWPSEVRVDPNYPTYFSSYGWSDASLIVRDDGQDGAWVGLPYYPTHGWPMLDINRYSAAGQRIGWGVSADPLYGHEREQRPDGALFIADFVPWFDLYDRYAPYPSLQLQQYPAPSGWTGFHEWHDSQVGLVWYGDIGLAATQDGGAVFVWSQVRERIGLFARKFSTYGEVTGVGPASAPMTALRGVRFERGVGVRAAFSTAGAGRLDLFDLAGRRVSTLAVERGDHEVTMPGTNAIVSGLYFVRLTTEGTALSAKVLAAPSLRP